MHDRFSLNTWWHYRVGNGLEEMKKVPFSALCVGESECWLDFQAPPFQGRAVLCFEGITYSAEVFLNGNAMGDMLPYCYYEFDVTDVLTPKDNQLRVALRDIGMPFGPSGGWENYGGIIRDVYIKYIPFVHISDYCWQTTLSPDMSSARCELTVYTNGEINPDGYKVSAQLLLWDRHIAQGTASIDDPINFDVASPALWSPDHPNLYTLKISLLRDEQLIDDTCVDVGFKELRAEGSQFLLNGEPLFLCGVCRHDTWGYDGGHTLIDEQMEYDMRMIKSIGANFVRLVHYPHNRRIIEIADRIGLLISEEPGLWWSDLSNPDVTGPALQVLEKTILRDRNHVSVAFWLAFNECILKPEFLAEAAAVCRRLDPTRMVSGANCMNVEMTRELFANFDFYTYHPYGSQIDDVMAGYGAPEKSTTLSEVLQKLHDKPLVFTEWGGWFVVDNPALFGQFMDAMITAGNSRTPGAMLAGTVYWAWSDMYETNRGLPACREGILNEGLVDVERNPRVNCDVFARKLAQMGKEVHGKVKMDICGAERRGFGYMPVDLTAVRESQDVWLWEKTLEAAIPMYGYSNKGNRRMQYGPQLPEDCYALGELPVDLRKGRPIIISNLSGPIDIPINSSASAVYFIGQVTITNGYPVCGAIGELAARYIITFEDGTQEEVLLRNGMELSTVMGLLGPSRIDPRTSEASRVMRIAYDENWEIYYINMLRVPLSQDSPIRSIRAEVLNEKYLLALYGITLETAIMNMTSENSGAII